MRRRNGLLRKRCAPDPSLRLKNGCAQDDALDLGDVEIGAAAGKQCSRLSARSSQVAFGFEEFGIEDGGPGSATDGVVREDGEFPVEDAAGAQASNSSRHASAQVDI